MKKSNSRGFTLLELLLVVGIAAILIVAGITTYSLVNKSNTATETIRLVNIVLDQSRRLFASTGSYTGTAAAMEAALVNTGKIPQKYISGVAGNISSPYGAAATDVTLTPAAGGATFTMVMNIAGNQLPDIAPSFDPRRDDSITSITACGTTITDATPSATAFNGATLAANATCNSSTPVALTIISR
jgi:prepilin-type N-terminal cleavage/methylation domain-containing protein